MSWYGSVWVRLVWDPLCFLSEYMFPSGLGKFSAITPLNTFLTPWSLFSSVTPVMQMLVHLMLFPNFLCFLVSCYNSEPSITFPHLVSILITNTLNSLSSKFIAISLVVILGFPGGKEPACQCRRHKRQVRSLGWEDPLEESMATHSHVLSWRIPWTM